LKTWRKVFEFLSKHVTQYVPGLVDIESVASEENCNGGAEEFVGFNVFAMLFGKKRVTSKFGLAGMVPLSARPDISWPFDVSALTSTLILFEV